MNKLRNILSNNKGATGIGTIAAAMFLLVVFSVGIEYLRLNVIAKGTSDDMAAVITQVCTNNYDKLYNGLREGYSGGYKLQNGNWVEEIDTDDAYTMLDKQLNTHSDGGGHAKYNGDVLEYRISDLSIRMTNTPFAPDDSESEQRFTAEAEYTVTIPLSFGWQNLPPIKIPMKVKSGYTGKF